MQYTEDFLAGMIFKDLQAMASEFKIRTVGKTKHMLVKEILKITSAIDSPLTEPVKTNSIIIEDELLINKIKIVVPSKDITCHIGGKWFVLKKGQSVKVPYDVFRILKSSKLIES